MLFVLFAAPQEDTDIQHPGKLWAAVLWQTAGLSLSSCLKNTKVTFKLRSTKIVKHRKRQQIWTWLCLQKWEEVFLPSMNHLTQFAFPNLGLHGRTSLVKETLTSTITLRYSSIFKHTSIFKIIFYSIWLKTSDWVHELSSKVSSYNHIYRHLVAFRENTAAD